jgi:hypothetical protein
MLASLFLPPVQHKSNEHNQGNNNESVKTVHISKKSSPEKQEAQALPQFP